VARAIGLSAGRGALSSPALTETLRINEVFFSIQGESTRMGRPCVFMRLAGCPMRCSYCDTEYAFREGATRSIDGLIDEVCAHPTDLVEVTGGEPLAQRSVHTLMTRLCDAGKTVLIETGGMLDIGACDDRVIRILDLKTPGSGESARMNWANVDRLTARDEVKFVVGDRTDYEWARDVVERYDLIKRAGAVLFSPVHEQQAGLEILGHPGLNPRLLAEWILEDGLDVVLQPQLHKHIWDAQTRGV